MQRKKLFGRASAVAALSFALAAPAGAGTIYSWRTDDGGYAFADDLRRVPEKYRERMETRQSADLAGHPRYTPQDDAAVDAYAKHLEQRLEGLRKRNQRLAEAMAASPRVSGGQDGVTVRVDSDGKPVIDIPSGATGAGGGPVIIEDVLAKPEGSSTTRYNTVIRRGDEVISIVRPANDSQRPYPRSESKLDEGEF